MFKSLKEKLIKRLSAGKEPEVQQVALSELNKWLDRQAALLDFNVYLREYFPKLAELKKQLKEKTEILKEQEISEKDKKQVEGRVQNIVTGHKDNYARTVGRFAQGISLPEKDSFTTVEDYQKALLSNENLQDRLDVLAQQTAKSYQAAQHLFFETVEKIFKLLGELNKRVKDFAKRAKENKIYLLSEIQQGISFLEQEIEKRKKMNVEIRRKEKLLSNVQKEKEEFQQQLTDLDRSDEHREYHVLRDTGYKLSQRYKDMEQDIFSFFSKLNKPLKKYERIALDNKPIKHYLENSITAFWNDNELKIVSLLQGLKKAIVENSLLFDEKQKNNFLSVIERSEQGYLQELQKKGKELEKEKEELEQKIKENTIIEKMEKTRQEIQNAQNKMAGIKKEIADLQLKSEMTDLEKKKTVLMENIRDVLNAEIKIT